jgi:hypothetical protein
MAEVLTQLAFFKPSPKDIKKHIEVVLSLHSPVLNLSNLVNLNLPNTWHCAIMTNTKHHLSPPVLGQSLIDRDYLERDINNPNTYKYLA